MDKETEMIMIILFFSLKIVMTSFWCHVLAFSNWIERGLSSFQSWRAATKHKPKRIKKIFHFFLQKCKKYFELNILYILFPHSNTFSSLLFTLSSIFLHSIFLNCLSVVPLLFIITSFSSNFYFSIFYCSLFVSLFISLSLSLFCCSLSLSLFLFYFPPYFTVSLTGTAFSLPTTLIKVLSWLLNSTCSTEKKNCFLQPYRNSRAKTFFPTFMFCWRC